MDHDQTRFGAGAVSSISRMANMRLNTGRFTQGHYQRLLKAACQPRHVSGNACIKLCYFIEQCSKASSSSTQRVAFSFSLCLDLFTFYVEWNEKNQHRSMRQVLDLMAMLISRNPDDAIAKAVKTEILQRLVSIINQDSAHSFAKPAFKVLECFLSKGTVSLMELIAAHKESHYVSTSISLLPEQARGAARADSSVSAVFEWMSFPETSPGAGKLLVTLFSLLRKETPVIFFQGTQSFTALWQRWIYNGLAKNPDSLENIKNYLFPPLFKMDRTGSIEFLKDLAQGHNFQNIESQDRDANVFLLLSVMEVGKKFGLVDESSKIKMKSFRTCTTDFATYSRAKCFSEGTKLHSTPYRYCRRSDELQNKQRQIGGLLCSGVINFFNQALPSEYFTYP
jgi:hypothetical protein